MIELWNKEVERRFFAEASKSFTPEELFYVTNEDKYLAYWPKDYKHKKYTLQSRNAPIGDFTEKWTTDLIQEIVKDRGLFAVKKAICKEIELTSDSPADVVISRNKNIIQEPEDIIVR